MQKNINLVAPSLRDGLRYLGNSSFSNFSLWFSRAMLFFNRLVTKDEFPPYKKIAVDRITGIGSVNVRVHRPENINSPSPALIWAHGGGHILGAAKDDDYLCKKIACELGITIFSVNYRLAPIFPFPADLHDAYSVLAWVHQYADELHVNPSKIAVGGASAGGGLAASLAQYAFDKAEYKICFQLLIYPMLDDRSALLNDGLDNVRTWTAANNDFAWSTYLGHAPGKQSQAEYAVPARRQDFSGLPNAWIGVGTLDLFHQECLAFKQSLNDAGVQVEIEEVQGAYHGFDMVVQKSPLSKHFHTAIMNALEKGFSD